MFDRFARPSPAHAACRFPVLTGKYRKFFSPNSCAAAESANKPLLSVCWRKSPVPRNRRITGRVFLLFPVNLPTPRRRTRTMFHVKHCHPAHTIYGAHFAYCFPRSAGVPPARAAGVTKQLWEMSDMVALLEAWECENRSG